MIKEEKFKAKERWLFLYEVWYSLVSVI